MEHQNLDGHPGGCLCGAVRYECTHVPDRVIACHCSHCRRASGSGYSLNIVVPETSVTHLGHPPAIYRDRSDAGRVVERMYCRECGSPIASRTSLLPGQLLLKAGSLDSPPQAAPVLQVWAASALPWAMLPSIPAREHG
ncbi:MULTISPECIES: GFA family protein [Burkholderia]|uniref:GFA family protein n=1 Tax=Burkholderia TaxID=32008 RepID=UPI0009E0983C|nr:MULTISPECIES: GFA family protein [Burkholderia]